MLPTLQQKSPPKLFYHNWKQKQKYLWMHYCWAPSHWQCAQACSEDSSAAWAWVHWRKVEKLSSPPAPVCELQPGALCCPSSTPFLDRYDEHLGSSAGCHWWGPHWSASGHCGGTSVQLQDSRGVSSHHIPTTMMSFSAWREEGSKGKRQQKQHLEVNWLKSCYPYEPVNLLQRIKPTGVRKPRRTHIHFHIVSLRPCG